MMTGCFALASSCAASSTASSATCGIVFVSRLVIGVDDLRNDFDLVAGNFDVAGPLVADDGVEDAVDLAEGDGRVDQFGRGDAQLLEHLELRAEVAHLVVEQRIVDALGQPRSAADDDDRRLFGVGPGDGVADREAADAVGDADRTQAVDAGIGVGREAGAVFARAADDVDRAFFELAVERQDVVAGNAEDVLQAVILQPADQVLADRQGLRGRAARGSSAERKPGLFRVATWRSPSRYEARISEQYAMTSDRWDQPQPLRYRPDEPTHHSARQAFGTAGRH